MRQLYLIASYLIHPLLKRYIKRRIYKGKEHKDRYVEKLGFYNINRPEGKLIWFHTASVGELNSVTHLIQELAKKNHVLVTTVTLNGFRNFELKNFSSKVIHQFAPLDTPFIVRKFLEKWHPDLGVFVDSELWPNLILESAKRFPLVNLNARMSDKSFKTWRYFKRFLSRIYQSFSEIYPSSEADKQKILSVIRRVGIVRDAQNLKFSAPKLQYDKQEAARLSELFSGKTVVVAASTHQGEEEIILRSFNNRDTILIIAPRHPERGAEVAKLAKECKLKSVLRSSSKDPVESTRVYIADTLGELGLFYHLANLVIMGGSFLPKLGGHNILEPAAFSKAIIVGEYHSNFKNIVQEFSDAKAIIVTSAHELQDNISQLLATPQNLKAIGARAKKLISSANTTEILRSLKSYL